MTEFDIQKTLFDLFLTLDSFAQAYGFQGEPFFERDLEGEVLNVHFPNKPFSYPEDKSWFDVTFRSNEPEDASLGKWSQNRFTGVLYVDVLTPQDVEEGEAENKYRWIAKMFNNAELDYIDIMKVYVSTKGNEADHYRLQVAVEWEADIDKE